MRSPKHCKGRQKKSYFSRRSTPYRFQNLYIATVSGFEHVLARTFKVDDCFTLWRIDGDITWEVLKCARQNTVRVVTKNQEFQDAPRHIDSKFWILRLFQVLSMKKQPPPKKVRLVEWLPIPLPRSLASFGVVWRRLASFGSGNSPTQRS